MPLSGDDERDLEVDALVFDVLGTLVDEVGTVERETRTAVERTGADVAFASPVARAWVEVPAATVAAVAAGEAVWVAGDSRCEAGAC